MGPATRSATATGLLVLWKRFQHPLSLSTMLKPGGRWEAEQRQAHSLKEPGQFPVFPVITTSHEQDLAPMGKGPGPQTRGDGPGG